MTRTVLVTGVSRYLGGRLAGQLASDPSVSRVIGVDIVPPVPPAPPSPSRPTPMVMFALCGSQL